MDSMLRRTSTSGFNVSWILKNADLSSTRWQFEFVEHWRPNASSDLSVYGQPQYWDNPYFVIKENYASQMHNRLIGNIGLTLNLAKGLELKSFARMSNYTNENDQRVASGD